MKHQFVDRPHASSRKNSTATYAASLALQALSFYCGFTWALDADIPPVYRLIAACVFFPLAAVSAGWGGHIALMRRGEKHYAVIQLFETLPIRIFLGIVFAAIVLAVISLTSAI
jgi:hypothetical protein